MALWFLIAMVTISIPQHSNYSIETLHSGWGLIYREVFPQYLIYFQHEASNFLLCLRDDLSFHILAILPALFHCYLLLNALSLVGGKQEGESLVILVKHQALQALCPWILRMWLSQCSFPTYKLQFQTPHISLPFPRGWSFFCSMHTDRMVFPASSFRLSSLGVISRKDLHTVACLSSETAIPHGRACNPKLLSQDSHQSFLANQVRFLEKSLQDGGASLVSVTPRGSTFSPGYSTSTNSLPDSLAGFFLISLLHLLQGTSAHISLTLQVFFISYLSGQLLYDLSPHMIQSKVTNLLCHCVSLSQRQKSHEKTGTSSYIFEQLHTNKIISLALQYISLNTSVLNTCIVHYAN